MSAEQKTNASRSVHSKVGSYVLYMLHFFGFFSLLLVLPLPPPLRLGLPLFPPFFLLVHIFFLSFFLSNFYCLSLVLLDALFSLTYDLVLIKVKLFSVLVPPSYLSLPPLLFLLDFSLFSFAPTYSFSLHFAFLVELGSFF